MVKVRLFPRQKSDVTEMTAKGWRIKIYSDETDGFVSEHATVERKGVVFLVQRDNDKIIVKKFVEGECTDKKIYDADGVQGCDGTLYINEQNDTPKSYAFFRNSEVQILLDSIGAERMSFRGEGCMTFEMTRNLDTEETDIVTDGNKIGERSYENCSYYLDRKRKELFLVQGTLLDEVAKKLL